MSAGGQIFVVALTQLPKEILAANLALLEEVTLFSALRNKVTRWFDSSAATIEAEIASKAQTLSIQSDSELALRLLSVMHEICEIPFRNYMALADFDDSAAEIIESCITFLKESEKSFNGDTLEDLIKYNVDQMFGQIGKHFEKMEPEKQEEILQALRTFIEKLPDEQRSAILKEIGVDQLSSEYVRKMLVSGGLSSAFAAAVSVGGFSFYVGAVSFLAAVTGLVGITLPFAFYTGLTSTIAVVANPIFFLPVLAGGGFLLYGSQNGKMRRRMVTMTLTQLALASLSSESVASDRGNRMLSAWRQAADALASARSLLKKAETEERQAQDTYSATVRSSQISNDQCATLVRTRADLISNLAEICIQDSQSLANGMWGIDLSRHGARMCVLKDEIQQAANTAPSGGLFAKARQGFANFAKNKKASSELQALAGGCASEIAGREKNGLIPNAAAVRILNEIIAVQVQIETSGSKCGALELEKTAQDADLKRAQKITQTRREAVQSAKERFRGMRDLP